MSEKPTDDGGRTDRGANSVREDEFDEELEDADSTALLAYMAQEISEIRYQLQMLNQRMTDRETGTDESDEEEIRYSCRMCNDQVPEDGREGHLRNEHNAPPNVTDVVEMFNRA